jgi:transcriptional regulator with XRE-family HTH domain
MTNNIGEKIRNFRKRSGISQFELELRIDASPGSISRIENGQINPTKETLIKIIDSLDLVGIEATSLFGVDLNISNLLKIPSVLLNANNLDEILAKSVNNIVYELNLLAAFITLRKGNKLIAQVTTDRWFNNSIFKLLSVPFNELSVDLAVDTNNLCVKCYKTGKNYLTNNLEEVTVPAITSNVARLMAKISGVRSGIVLPITYANDCYGTFYVGKTYVDDFQSELPILEEFTKYIGGAIALQIGNSKS